MNSPKMPAMPAETPAPPSREEEAANRAAAAQREQARMSRGRRSTVIAGNQALAPALGGTKTMLGGGSSMTGAA